MHALVDVGHRVTRGIDQGVAAPLGFTQRSLQAPHRSARLHCSESIGDGELQNFRMIARCHPRHAGSEGCLHALITEFPQHGDYRHVFSAALDNLNHAFNRDDLGFDAGHHQIKGLLADQLFQLLF